MRELGVGGSAEPPEPARIEGEVRRPDNGVRAPES
jgi:hypothetical protein